MQTYDIFMLIVLAGATLFGFWKGLAWQLASLASIFLSYFAAVYFRGPVAAAIDAEPPWNMFLAMLIVYIAASLVIWVAFGFVRRMISNLQLKEFDRQVGGLLGLAKGVLLCVIITLFAVTLLGDDRRRQIVNSTSGYYIAVLLDRSHSIMPPEVHEVLHPYIENLEQPRSPDVRFGGPLFGGANDSNSPQWPLNPTSNPTLNGSSDAGQSGGWGWSGGGAQPAPEPMRDLQQWSDQQIRSGREAIENSVRDGGRQIRDQVDQQLDRYLPPR